MRQSSLGWNSDALTNLASESHSEDSVKQVLYGRIDISGDESVTGVAVEEPPRLLCAEIVLV